MHLITTIKFSPPHTVFLKKLYNKIKRELYATDCECFEIKFYTADRLPCLAVKCSKSDPLNLKECTRQLTRMMDLMPSDFAAVNSTLPACAMIPNQQNFTRHDERFNFSAKSGKFTSVSRAIKRSDIHLEVLSSQSRKSFEYFLCFHRTLGVSLKDLEGFKVDIAFIYTTLACSLTI